VLVKITLLGHLGQVFGKEWSLSVRSPVEAIRAIAAQSPGFVDYLNTEQAYEVIVDNGDDFVLDSRIQQSMTICPHIAGSGAVGRIILGVALLGASLLIPGAILGVSSTTIGLFGASMILGGITQLLSPQEQNDSEGKESFLYDASGVSRAVQGAPVPLLYGDRIFAPVPISVVVDNAPG
jgi:predicted phage tail protein